MRLSQEITVYGDGGVVKEKIRLRGKYRRKKKLPLKENSADSCVQEFAGGEGGQPAISIIIPVYNVKEEYLRRNLQSFSWQWVNNVELILVDDGSAKAAGIADISSEAFQEQAKAILREQFEDCGWTMKTILHKKNAGVSAARNDGIEASTGKYLYFIDADDYILEGGLYYLYQEMEKHDCDLVTGNFRWLRRDRFEDYDQITKYEQADIKAAMHTSCCGFTKLYRSEIIKKNKIKFPMNIRTSEDLVFYHHYLSCCEKPILLSPRHIAVYRMHATNSTKRYKSKTEDTIKALHKIEEYYKEKEELKEEFKKDELFHIKKTLKEIKKNNHREERLNEFSALQKEADRVYSEAKKKEEIKEKYKEIKRTSKTKTCGVISTHIYRTIRNAASCANLI